ARSRGPRDRPGLGAISSMAGSGAAGPDRGRGLRRPRDRVSPGGAAVAAPCLRALRPDHALRRRRRPRARDGRPPARGAATPHVPRGRGLYRPPRAARPARLPARAVAHARLVVLLPARLRPQVPATVRAHGRGRAFVPAPVPHRSTRTQDRPEPATAG